MSDFSATYDINEDGHPFSFSISALDTKEFPEPIADHLADHLAKKIAFQTRGRGSYEVAYLKALASIKGEE